jgi:putative transposase
VPIAPNERWSMDFVHDTLGDGRVIRIFTLVDDFTRTCTLIAVHFALPAPRVIALLDELAARTALPRTIGKNPWINFWGHVSDPSLLADRRSEGKYGGRYSGRSSLKP